MAKNKNNTSNNPVTCNNRGQNGHIAKNCRRNNNDERRNNNNGGNFNGGSQNKPKQSKSSQNGQGNQSCSICKKTNHVISDCKFKPNGKNSHGQQGQVNTQNGNGNDNGSESWAHCNKNGHLAAECFSNPDSQNFEGNRNNNNSNSTLNWQHGIGFDRACQLCGQSDHSAQKCPSLNQQASQYAMSWPPPAAVPQAQTLPWNPQYYQQQQHQSAPQPTQIREEFPVPVLLQTQIPTFTPPRFRGPTKFNDYTNHQCERLIYMDRDGDVIMSSVEGCYQCQAQSPGQGDCRVDIQGWGSHLWTEDQDQSAKYQILLQHQKVNQGGFGAMNIL